MKIPITIKKRRAIKKSIPIEFDYKESFVVVDVKTHKELNKCIPKTTKKK